MRKTITSTAVALSAAALTFGLAGPANADSIGDRDPKDTYHGSDLRSVELRNKEHSVVVVTTHSNLTRDWRSGSSGSVYLDTDRTDRGPEYVFTGGYFEGSDYALVRTEGFGYKNWGEVVSPGSYALNVSYDREHVWMKMSRRDLGFPGKVRVAVKVSGTRTDGTSTGLTDWLDEPRSFTSWVDRG